MSLNIGILKETHKGESRVAATPDTVKKYISLGFKVSVEKDAGKASGFDDALYKELGATIAASAAAAVEKADLILCIREPEAGTLAAAKKKAVLAAMLNPFSNTDNFKNYNGQTLTAISMELMPRITRAQNMDVLSSQANLAGYRAVIDGAHSFEAAFPMMMTAAGTIPPAKVFVMGAGVAGLQAIATAKRLGAVVSATDVRLAAKEQVESLGGNFVMVEDDEAKEAETAGGYAKEMSKEYQKKQADLIAETIKTQDIVICTALIPGRPAPVLVSEDMVKTMKPGTVIVDLAVEQGGNCPLSEADKIVEKHDVKLIGYTNMASRVCKNASSLYARNLQNLVAYLYDEEAKGLKLDFEDDVTKSIVLTHAGKTVHERFANEGSAPGVKKPTAKKTTAKKTTSKKASSK